MCLLYWIILLHFNFQGLPGNSALGRWRDSGSRISFLFFKNWFYLLFLAALGFHGFAGFSLVVASRGSSSSCGALASQCSGFSCRAWALGRVGFSCCGALAELFCSMWDLPGMGIKPRSPSLAGRFLTTGPLGKSQQ